MILMPHLDIGEVLAKTVDFVLQLHDFLVHSLQVVDLIFNYGHPLLKLCNQARNIFISIKLTKFQYRNNIVYQYAIELLMKGDDQRFI